jgi:tyrosyl-tRNA synthetase
VELIKSVGCEVIGE